MFFGFLLLLFLSFRSMALANDISVSWVNVPSNASMNNQFDLQVKVIGDTATTYYLKVDNASSCTLEQLKTSNNSWSNSCNVGVAEMQSIVLGNDGSGTETLRMKEISSSGNKTIYAYVYNASRNLLATSSSNSISIIDVTPTLTPTITPTITLTPTPTLTLTITPTPKKMTPTPTEKPVIEPTDVPEPTIIPTLFTENKEITDKKNNANLLPIVFIVFGLLMVGVPFLVSKIMTKIKFKKQNKPPMIPPFTGLTDQPLQ